MSKENLALSFSWVISSTIPCSVVLTLDVAGAA